MVHNSSGVPGIDWRGRGYPASLTKMARRGPNPKMNCKFSVCILKQKSTCGPTPNNKISSMEKTNSTDEINYLLVSVFSVP